MEIERPVEIKRVAMMKRDDGSWDAHVTIGCSNPSIELGTFVMSAVRSPKEFTERFPEEAKAFLDEEVVEKRSYSVPH